MMRLCFVLAAVLATVLSDTTTKKCKQCVELDVANAKGSASANGVSMTFTQDMMTMMNLNAKVDDNGMGGSIGHCYFIHISKQMTKHFFDDSIISTIL